MKKKVIIISTIVLIVCAISVLIAYKVIDSKEYEGRTITTVEPGCTYVIAATGEELKEGAKIPAPVNGDIYKTKDYEYRYIADYTQDRDGNCYYLDYWQECDPVYDIGDRIEVKCSLKGLSGWEHNTTDIEKETYEDIAGSIAGEPIVQISFYQCTKMKKSPSIPKSVVLMWNTYAECESLVKSPAIPSNVEIMWNTYRNCVSLEKAPKIPDGVIIMKATFLACEKIKEMPRIPESVRVMSYTFEGCTSLKKTKKLPDDVLTIKSLFEGCTSLKKVPDIPDGVYNIERAFFKCTNLKRVKKVPSSVRNMAHTFSYCESLTGTIKIETKEAYILSCFNQVNFEEQRLKLKGDKEFVERLLKTNKVRW